MLKFLTNMFVRENNAKLVKKMLPLVNKINALEETISQLNDIDLKNQTIKLKQLLTKGKTLNYILPEAFATVRETSKRVLGQRHYDVQLMGGITLHNCMIAEMITGEGKTLVSTLPAYLNALSEKGVHIITVNDYLAQRDRQWMGQIFEFLGLSVGVIVANTTEEERRKAYASDITYGTNNEFGFDYLRDNMKLNVESMILKPFNFAIVDEIDSILIDEARTPLIISGQAEDKTEVYKIVAGFVKLFNKGEDFELDEKHKSINITEEGLVKLEKLMQNSGLMLNGSLFDTQNIQLYHFVTQALRAYHLFKKEVDYIVKDNHIVIIDEFTGRMMDGRRFSDGLHQSLEAKEGIRIRQESQTLASITYQNYFKLYPRLSGMTGTAMTEAQEFAEIYSLKVVAIPSHRPLQRKDYNDEIYLKYQDKEKALVTKVKELHAKQQPILIGTVSIERSELLSQALKKAHIPHHILNAKNHEKEAFIISQAGSLGAVTIATNMAGRGTDIQLGGNVDMLLAQEDLSQLNAEEIQRKKQLIQEKVQTDKEKVLSLGGLFVLGTERHESRRIDNQLRGRSGRQGESGVSTFYISLEDDLMRVFGSNKLEGTLKRLGFKEDESISHPMISRAIEKAQKRVEQYNFESRKNLLKFDNVINEQRKVIYEQRKHIIIGDTDINHLCEDSIEDILNNVLKEHMPENEYREKWNISTIKADLTRLFNITNLNIEQLLITEAIAVEDFLNLVKTQSQEIISSKKSGLPKEIFEGALREVSLQILDFSWKKHLMELDYVRGSINLRAYANKDPFNEYQKESFLLFSAMLEEFKEKLVSVIHHIEFSIEAQSKTENNPPRPPIVDRKIGRNDPCPCGSGKKYKQCHGK